MLVKEHCTPSNQMVIVYRYLLHLKKNLTLKYSSVISQLQTECHSNQDKLVAPNTTKDALPRLDVSENWE
jgi:hypothetical protein